MDIEIVNRFLLIFTSLFVIVDPFGIVPTFLGLTAYYEPKIVQRINLKANLIGALSLLFFSLFGNALFSFLQLDLAAFRAAGGVLLFLTSLDMLRSESSLEKCTPEELQSGKEHHDISFVPIGIPLLSGPGAMTSVMVFANDHKLGHATEFVITAAAIGSVFFASYVILRSSVRVKKLLGQSGISVLQRLMGLILAALSIQFIFQGGLELIKKYGT